MTEPIAEAKRTEPELLELRQLMFSIAYRMLGSVAEAEDIVQEGLLRWHRAEQEGLTVDSPRAFLTTVTTRLAIDHLRSARVRRETYVGPWLPEPLVDGGEASVVRSAEISESLSTAFLILLESLAPVERAVFLLREVFDYDYDEIASIVEKSEDNCRQIFNRARRRIDERRPRFEPSAAKRAELAGRFLMACQDGDLAGLESLLASDIVFQGDGGGNARAALHPVNGIDRVARLVHAIFVQGRAYGIRPQPATVNGQPGILIFDSGDRLITAMALQIEGGAVHAIHSVVNPDKLSHLGPVSDLNRLPQRER